MGEPIQIIRSYVNVIAGSPKTKELADTRLAICKKCEHLTDMMGIDVCGNCNCPLIGKTSGESNKCPQGKW